MTQTDKDISLLILSGELGDAQKLVASLYPGQRCTVLSKRELREVGWRGQIRTLRKIKGGAFVFFVRRFSDLQEPQLVALSSLLHRCRTTVLADGQGRVVTYNRWAWLRLVPKAAVSACLDAMVLLAGWLVLRLTRNAPVQVSNHTGNEPVLELAYLYPFPLDTSLAGGAMTHVEGFLSGVASSGGSCEVFSGRSLPVAQFKQHLIPANRKFYLLRESLMLSYNLRFARAVKQLLRGQRVGALYQRHGRFMVAGVLLSRWLQVPLILEYNGSEVWVAKHWDSLRFAALMQLCERISLGCAHHIVVVSEPSKDELLQQGLPPNRILVNPNGVDPEVFHPGSGREQMRGELGIAENEIVVGFVGTFDRWHGVEVLATAILQLLSNSRNALIPQQLRFLLVGDGPLHAETRESLKSHVGNSVLFTGLVRHGLVPAYLDSMDILVSPHIPMPDDRPFFGSPTKLFEYMAMGKAIVASNLDQLAKVLQHGCSAWLVQPGSVSELASAIELLARNPELRQQLGQSARASALASHTWRQNAERVMMRIQASPAPVIGSAIAAVPRS